MWLRTRNLRSNRPYKKLDWLALPYRMLELIGSHAVRLNVPRGVHDVFHVNLLRRATDDPLPSQQLENIEPPALLVDGVEEYEVEEICHHRR